MSYRQLLANLEALPEEERQLAAFQYLLIEDGKEVCGCVLGKGVPALRKFVKENMRLNCNLGIGASRFAGVDLGDLTRNEAFAAQEANDYADVGAGTNEPASRRTRYAHMIEWLRARVFEENEPRAAPSKAL